MQFVGVPARAVAVLAVVALVAVVAEFAVAEFPLMLIVQVPLAPVPAKGTPPKLAKAVAGVVQSKIQSAGIADWLPTMALCPVIVPPTFNPEAVV
jgi:hypothetical protein